MTKIYHVKPISSSNYNLKGDVTKIPVVGTDNKNYFLTYPSSSQLIPPEYFRKHRLTTKNYVLISALDSDQKYFQWKVEGNRINNIIKADKITGSWVNAQEYLDEQYPNARTSVIRNLNLKDKGLVGHLDLTQFVDLEEVNCSNNYLSSIKTPATVKKILVADNCLISMNDLTCNWDNLDELILKNNPLDLEEFATMFIKLKVLANNHQAEVDKDERITHLKDQLDRMSTQLISEKKISQEWVDKYQLLKAELEQKKSQQEKLEQERNNNQLSNWWKEYQTPAIIFFALLVIGGGGIWIYKKFF